MRRLRRVFAPLAAATACGASAAAADAATTTVSSNWAGYAVMPSTSTSTTRFRHVSGTWKVTAGSCTPGSASSAVAWVGLGGYANSSTALEQTGTELDCSPSGRATYSAWYELVPAAPVAIHMAIRPGDTISASVQVRGHSVRVRLTNVTRGTKFTRDLRMAAPDTSSAEWIVEAPSECDGSGSCSTVTLSNFGATPFSRASVTTVRGRAGTISSAAWARTAIELRPSSGDRRGPPDVASTATNGGAAASALSAAGSAFAVTYQAAGSASG